VIRRATAADARAIAALARVTDPDADIDAADLASVMRVDGRCDLVAAEGDAIVGWAFCEIDGAATAQVAPASRRRGTGTSLLASAAEKTGSSRLTIEVREQAAEGLGYLGRRGFREVARELTVALDLATAGTAAHAVPGVTITTRADRPGLEEAMYRVAVEAEPDIPADSPSGPGSYTDWRLLNLDRPGRRPELTFVGLAGGHVVAFAILHAGPGDTCYHGMTAVARGWRGRGIARALKERQIDAARAAGFRRLVTENEVRNAPIRHLNEVLGYRSCGATLFLSGPASAIRPRA
jgi:GNAT superfamily N-acetyltransferase